MISGDFSKHRLLADFYAAITTLHEKHHGSDYTRVHDAIQNLVSPIKIYKEFGVNQGATAAAALLCVPYNTTIIDHKLSRWEPYRKIFENFAKLNGVPFEAKEMSSLDKATKSHCDVLYIDTTHVPSVLSKELLLHSPDVSEYIICHDTFSKPELQTTIQKFCEDNSWEIIEYDKKSVGYTIMERTNEHA